MTTKNTNSYLFFHLNGITDLFPTSNNPAMLPTTQVTTKEYIRPLMKILRSWTKVGRSRMSRIGWEFWSWGSLINHIAPGRITLRQPDKRTANVYLRSNVKWMRNRSRMSSSHEHRAGYPMVEHSSQRSLRKECNPRNQICFREQPHSAQIKDNAATERKSHQFDENESSDLDSTI